MKGIVRRMLIVKDCLKNVNLFAYFCGPKIQSRVRVSNNSNTLEKQVELTLCSVLYFKARWLALACGRWRTSRRLKSIYSIDATK